LSRLGADIAIVQECSRPGATDDQCIYFHKLGSKGVAVITKEPWRVEAATPNEHVLDSAYPVLVSGPQSFHLLAIWAQRSPTYVRAILGALDDYGDFLRAAPSIVIGDFNSHLRWDRNDRNANHSVLVRRLQNEFGLVSAFHAVAERDGRPETPTYFHQWNETRPYHIDYAFIPSSWAPRLLSVEIGSYADWSTESDHRPLIIALDLGEPAQPASS
jgi:hypothetical protein